MTWFLQKKTSWHIIGRLKSAFKWNLFLGKSILSVCAVSAMKVKTPLQSQTLHIHHSEAETFNCMNEKGGKKHFDWRGTLIISG